MPFCAVIFDLDGTLLDTVDDIAWSTNTVLREFGFPAHPREAFRQFIGDGATVLFRRALPAEAQPPALVEQCLQRFLQVYGEHWNVETQPYPEIAELLDGCAARGLRLAVLSNKPDLLTQRCVAAYFADKPLEAVLGQRPGVPRKPDPTGALDIARQLEIPAAQFLYLGDTATDMHTAQAAGMTPLGALWGFRPADELRQAGAHLLLERPTQLLNALDDWPDCGGCARHAPS